MKRREFITLLGGAAAVWPITVLAQQSTMPVVGFIHILSPEQVPHFVPAFHRGLKEAGFVEGQNVAVEYRWTYGQYDRMPELAKPIQNRQVAVIAALGGEPSPQIEKAARTIPIVFVQVIEPVGSGFVESLARPGGNVTGFTQFEYSLAGKWVELLKQIAPHVTRAAVIRDPTRGPGIGQFAMVQAIGLGWN